MPDPHSAGTTQNLPVTGTDRRSRIPTLDGVRGLAIALVMINHFARFGDWEPVSRLDRVVYAVATTGWWGVDLFFVLSGFLITGILLDTKESSHYFRSFYLRRVLRIFPLFYGTLAALTWLGPLVVESGGVAYLRRQAPWFWGYGVNLLYAREGWPDALWLGHFWSLAVEEQFYLFWPLVVWLCRARTLARVCLALILGSVLFRMSLAMSGETLAAYVLTPARMDTLGLGALLAVEARSRNALARAARAARIMGPFATIGLLVMLLRMGELSPESGSGAAVGLTLAGVLSATLLVRALAAPAGSATARFFESRSLAFLGRYSYGLYVIHLPLTFLIAGEVFAVSAVPLVAGSHLPGLLLFTVTAGLGSVALALLSWYAWERPFLRLKRHVRYT